MASMELESMRVVLETAGNRMEGATTDSTVDVTPSSEPASITASLDHDTSVLVVDSVTSDEADPIEADPNTTAHSTFIPVPALISPPVLDLQKSKPARRTSGDDGGKSYFDLPKAGNGRTGESGRNNTRVDQFVWEAPHYHVNDGSASPFSESNRGGNNYHEIIRSRSGFVGKARRPLNIAMICDFFFPRTGGVETAIYSLAEALAQRGHKVVIITHAYPPRSGIRYLPFGLKVYYIPVQPLPPTHVHATLPGFFTALPYVRNIFHREQIDVLHAHASLSAEGMEGIFHARSMGIRVVFTDHSLFGLGNMAEIWGNKMLKGCLSDVEAVICVSHTGKENTVLRGALNPSIVYVIPNAVVASHFRPADPQPPIPDIITIVCVTRLVYRKGIDLLIAALPKVCALHPDVRILIGGDGPKIVELDQMRDKHQSLLRDRVELLGAVRHEHVRNLLSRAQIFLNPSLTEAFGIGILEAACAGLFVVSTRVGGVPEVLPPGLVEYAEPEVEDLVRAISRAILHVRSGAHDPLQAHEMLREMYSWADVAERTERVYNNAVAVPVVPVIERLRRYYGTGLIFGKMLCIIICVDYILLAMLDYFFPRSEIDLAPPFKLSTWIEMCEEKEDEDRALGEEEDEHKSDS